MVINISIGFYFSGDLVNIYLQWNGWVNEGICSVFFSRGGWFFRILGRGCDLLWVTLGVSGGIGFFFYFRVSYLYGLFCKNIVNRIILNSIMIMILGF